jgi:hypothetical protein
MKNMPIALHQKHDDSCKPVEHTARTEFTKDSSSAALPFAEHHRTGHPVCRYFSQPRLYLVNIIALKSAIVNTFLKFYLPNHFFAKQNYDLSCCLSVHSE